MTRLLLALCLTVPFAVAAQGDDAPIPYSDDDESTARPRAPEPDPAAIAAYEPEDVSELGYDDPNVGVGAELLAGLMLLDSTRGALVDTRFGYGARLVWEFGRATSSEALREHLFADVSWVSLQQSDGTAEVFARSTLHTLTVAPAYAFLLGEGSPLAIYLQLGAGLAYQTSTLTVSGNDTRVAGVKPVLQYGIGFRVRPPLNGDASIRFAFRIELTRYRRGYMDDTLIAASLGLVF